MKILNFPDMHKNKDWKTVYVAEEKKYFWLNHIPIVTFCYMLLVISWFQTGLSSETNFKNKNVAT